ncbi:MAG: hypothetical protein OHK0046_47610 [Anaerolineae bacterium]
MTVKRGNRSVLHRFDYTATEDIAAALQHASDHLARVEKLTLPEIKPELAANDQFTEKRLQSIRDEKRKELEAALPGAIIKMYGGQLVKFVGFGHNDPNQRGQETMFLAETKNGLSTYLPLEKIFKVGYAPEKPKAKAKPESRQQPAPQAADGPQQLTMF